jgi:uncharacterized protein with NRDE domain
MSLLAIVYHLVPEAPILVAFNRDSPFDQAFPSPSIQSGKPRVLASTDQNGGTCLGINQNGLFVGMTSRLKRGDRQGNMKSRQLLVREILKTGSAREGLELAQEELHTGQYRGSNFVIADPDSGWVVHAGNDLNACELEQGLSIITDKDVNSRNDARGSMAQRLLTLQTLDSPVKFLAIASKVLARSPLAPNRPSMVVREKDYGTVSSTLIAVGTKPRDAIYQYANGAPDEAKYEDYSPMLRDILSRGLRENRAKAAAAAAANV